MEIVKHTKTPKNYPMSVCLFATSPYRAGQILVVRRKADFTKLCLPGGKVQDHETVLEALIREALEETGIILNPADVYPIYTGLCEDDSGENFYWNICFYKSLTMSELNAQALEPELDNHWCLVKDFEEKNAFKKFNSNVLAASRLLGLT